MILIEVYFSVLRPFHTKKIFILFSRTNQTQNTTVNGNVNQQILALASMPFGDTPLFKNLLPVIEFFSFLY